MDLETEAPVEELEADADDDGELGDGGKTGAFGNAYGIAVMANCTRDTGTYLTC